MDVNQGSVAASASWSAGTERDGVHTLTISAADRAGNTVGTTRTVTLDTSPPTTTITSGPGVVGQRVTAAFTFTGADNLTPPGQLMFSWRLDGGAWSPYVVATSAVFSGLAVGTHRFEVRARDLAGNEDPTPAQRSFSVVAGTGGTASDESGDILRRVEDLVRTSALRTLDAIHIGSCLEARAIGDESLVFVTADVRQRRAAEAADLRVTWVE